MKPKWVDPSIQKRGIVYPSLKCSIDFSRMKKSICSILLFGFYLSDKTNEIMKKKTKWRRYEANQCRESIYKMDKIEKMNTEALINNWSKISAIILRGEFNTYIKQSLKTHTHTTQHTRKSKQKTKQSICD